MYCFILCFAESELTCLPPHRKIPHGDYSRKQQKYLLNDRVVYYCNQGYYLWGEQTWVCRLVDDTQATWFPGNCPPYGDCSVFHLECLLPTLYDEKCRQKTGQHATFNNNNAFCPSSPGTVGD